MNRYNIIKSGSSGNAILYHGEILVDIGVPYSAIKEYERDISLVLLTHIHGDHLNLRTLKRLASERPTLRIGACEWMSEYLTEFRNVDVYDIGKIYDYKRFQLSPVKLYHDVQQCGYRLFKDDYKIFHATDTAHLKGITAKDYDLYALEFNHDEEVAERLIREAYERGEFTHLTGSIKTHLSEQKATEFYLENKAAYSEVIRLHESSTAL